MRCPEGVVHPDLGEACQLRGERRVVLLLLGVEAQVLEQQHVPRCELRHGGLRCGADAVRCERDRSPEQFGEAMCGRREALRGIGLALRSTEVRRNDHLRAALGDEPDGRQARADAGVVGDALASLSVAFEGDVEVHPHEHPLPPQIQLVDDLHVRGSLQLVGRRVGPPGPNRPGRPGGR